MVPFKLLATLLAVILWTLANVGVAIAILEVQNQLTFPSGSSMTNSKDSGRSRQFPGFDFVNLVSNLGQQLLGPGPIPSPAPFPPIVVAPVNTAPERVPPRYGSNQQQRPGNYYGQGSRPCVCSNRPRPYSRHGGTRPNRRPRPNYNYNPCCNRLTQKIGSGSGSSEYFGVPGHFLGKFPLLVPTSSTATSKQATSNSSFTVYLMSTSTTTEMPAVSNEEVEELLSLITT